MKIYDPVTDTAVPSYQVGNEPRIFQKGTRDTHWEIDVPSKDGETREKVVTVNALSINRAEVMCGRASLVWMVVKFHERFNPKEVRSSPDPYDSTWYSLCLQIYVLKRYWRPYRAKPPRSSASSADSTPQPFDAGSVVAAAQEVLQTIPSEGELYSLFDSYEERVYSYEDIVVDGFVDSTLEGIRRGMRPLHPRTKSKGMPNSKKRVRAVEDDQGADPFVRMDTTPRQSTSEFIEPVPEENIRDPMSRAHAQILIPNPGWVIRRFKSLSELLCSILASVKGMSVVRFSFPC